MVPDVSNGSLELSAGFLAYGYHRGSGILVTSATFCSIVKLERNFGGTGLDICT